MKSSIYVISSSLKELLSLFDSNVELSHINLGDTMHPSSGFVDEKILKGKSRVSEILDFDYDFIGLIEFNANVGSTKIEMVITSDKKEEYSIKGKAKEIEIIKNKIIEVNALHPNKYKFEYHIEYGVK